MEQIFAVNKPRGITSHDVVNIIRRKTGVKRVGHGGTLDPLASGVLVIAVGREHTKQLGQYVKGEKEYIAQITLGFASTTDDMEGKLQKIHIEHIPTSEEVSKTINSFIGIIQQTPPLHSAMKVNGTRAYTIARRDNPQNIMLKPREVVIKKIKILAYTYPILKIQVICGPGVYIRSLARDLGKRLKTGAYLSELVRTRVGDFNLETARSVEEFKT